MPIPLEQARAVTAWLDEGQIANLFAQAQASHVLHEVREDPENFPAFDRRLDDKATFSAYAVLAAGASMIELGRREEGGTTLERSASLLAYIHRPRARESRESSFHVLVASMAFYAAGQYSRAFVTIREVEQQTLAGQAIGAFLRKNASGLIGRLNEIFLGAVPEIQEQADLNEWAITLAIARALGLTLEFMHTGDAALRELADAELTNAAVIASLGSHSAWWWVVRLLRLMLGDLGSASPWTVLPPFFGPEESRQLSRYIRVLAFAKRPVSEFWSSQLAALPLALNSSNRGAVINLRTSAGKTRVAELAILQTLMANPGARVLYLAPFRSLAIEVEHTLEETFSFLGLNVSHLYGGSRVSSVDTELASESAVTIATPEKAKALLRAAPELFNDVKLLILDEGHLIGPPERYVRNEVFVDHMRVLATATGARVLLLSAVLPNPQELAEWTVADRNAVATSFWKPSAERFGLLRWTGSKVRIDWLGEVESFNPSFVVARRLGFGRRRKPFPSDKNEAIAASAVRLSSVGPVMIFTARASSVQNLAKAVLLALGETPAPHPWPDQEWKVFEAVCEEELGEESIEFAAARAGVICHSNRLTPQVRLAIEHLMRSRAPRIIVATTTLAQGVNVGISSVIVATPYIDQTTIGKRDFWNICGRAGRAFVDGEGKIVYAIDQTKETWQVRKDEQLARSYFEPGANERVESGILAMVSKLRDLAELGDVEFETLLELAANNDFSSLGDEAPACERICDLLDDELLAMQVDPLVNPEGQGPDVWVENVFRGSLAAIQAAGGGVGVSPEDLFGFLKARARSAVERFPNERARRAAVSSGLPLSAALKTGLALDKFREIADAFQEGGRSLEALAAAVKEFEKWARANTSSVVSAVPARATLDRLRLGWLGGVAQRELVELDNDATEILRDFYAYQLPWLVHASSQQIRSEGETERADALATVALLLELGLPNELAARIFLAGVRSRAAATELSAVDADFGSTVSEVRRNLRLASFSEGFRDLVSPHAMTWLDLVVAEARRLFAAIPEFPPFSLEESRTNVLQARKKGNRVALCSADGKIVVDIAPTAEHPFERVANDPRVAFVKTGEEWNITVRDPRLE